MPYDVSIDDARRLYPEFTFVSRLTASEQKAAFHVRNADGDDLCLKLIAPNSSRDRLDREILALQSIDHPNVVGLREYLFSSKPGSQRHYVLEEFIDGSDLSEQIGDMQNWGHSDAAKFFIQLADGLSALANLNIVHRDLKPNNIRVRSDGAPVIIDFGVARFLDKTDLTATAQGGKIGTPIYFAPEQFAGTRREIDGRTDLFALGVLMYEALVGRHPFFSMGMGFTELQDRVCSSEEFKSDPDFAALPDGWRMLIGRLLEKTRVRRPNNAALVGTMLKSLEDQS